MNAPMVAPSDWGGSEGAGGPLGMIDVSSLPEPSTPLAARGSTRCCAGSVLLLVLCLVGRHELHAHVDRHAGTRTPAFVNTTVTTNSRNTVDDCAVAAGAAPKWCG